VTLGGLARGSTIPVAEPATQRGQHV